MDKGIRQKSTKEWTHSLTIVPFVRGHRTVPPRTRETSSRTMSRHVWRVDTAPGQTRKKRNACQDVRRSAVENKIAGLYGIRCELVNNKLLKTTLWNISCQSIYLFNENKNVWKLPIKHRWSIFKSKILRGLRKVRSWTNMEMIMDVAFAFRNCWIHVDIVLRIK